MDPLADDSRGENRGWDPRRSIANHSAIGSGDQILGALVRLFRPHRKNTLRRQPLLDIQTRDYGAELIVERYLEQTVTHRRAPDLFGVNIVAAQCQTARIQSRRDLFQFTVSEQIQTLSRSDPDSRIVRQE